MWKVRARNFKVVTPKAKYERLLRLLNNFTGGVMNWKGRSNVSSNKAGGLRTFVF